MKKINNVNPKVLLYSSLSNNKSRIRNANKIDSSLMDLSNQLKNISINDTHILKILSKNKSVISPFSSKKDYQTIYGQSQYSKNYLDTDVNLSSNTVFYNDPIQIRESQIITSSNRDFKIKHVGSFSMNGLSSNKLSSKEDLCKENFSLKENIKFLLNQVKKFQRNELNLERSSIKNNEKIEPESMIFEIKKEFEDKITYYISEIKKYKKEIKLLKEQNNKLKAENKELLKLINVKTDNVNGCENFNTNSNEKCTIETLNSDSTKYPMTNYIKFCRNNTGKTMNCINNNFCYQGYINNSNSIKKPAKKSKILHISTNNMNNLNINNSNINQKRNLKNRICNTQTNNNSVLGREYIVLIDKPNNLFDTNSYRERKTNKNLIPKSKNNNIKFIIKTNKNDIIKNNFIRNNISNKNTPLVLYKKIDKNKTKIDNIEYMKPASLKKIGCICATPTLIQNKSQSRIIRNTSDALFINDKNNSNGIKLEGYIRDKIYLNLRNNKNVRKKLNMFSNNTFSKEGL